MNGKERCAIIVTHSSEAASHGDEVLGLMVKCMVLNDKKSLRAQGLGTWSANYRFECLLNGEESEIMIPALKD